MNKNLTFRGTHGWFVSLGTQIEIVQSLNLPRVGDRPNSNALRGQLRKDLKALASFDADSHISRSRYLLEQGWVAGSRAGEIWAEKAQVQILKNKKTLEAQEAEHYNQLADLYNSYAFD